MTTRDVLLGEISRTLDSNPNHPVDHTTKMLLMGMQQIMIDVKICNEEKNDFLEKLNVLHEEIRKLKEYQVVYPSITWLIWNQPKSTAIAFVFFMIIIMGILGVLDISIAKGFLVP